MTFDVQDVKRVRTSVVLTAAAAWVLLFKVVPANSHCAVAAAAPMSLPDELHMIFTLERVSALAGGWFLMIAAMMAPTTAPAVLHVYRHTFARRRLRSIAFFLAGYVAVWMSTSLVLACLAALIAACTATWWVAPSGLLACAFIWQCSPFKQICLNRCHKHPSLTAFGFAADRDALRFGVDHGMWCAGSCWLWMLLASMLPEVHLLAMAVATLLIISERLEEPQRPQWGLRGFVRLTRLCAAQLRMLPGRSHPRPAALELH